MGQSPIVGFRYCWEEKIGYQTIEHNLCEAEYQNCNSPRRTHAKCRRHAVDRRDRRREAHAREQPGGVRAREVGQSFGSSVPSTLRALFACVHLIWTASPDLVLVNGPGTCVPVAVLARLSGSRVIFVESWCRVESLSLTGRVLYYVAHRFVVHWPELVDRYPRAEYLGRIC